jgi:ribosomal protein S18 acetylase RimI-like enzyme
VSKVERVLDDEGLETRRIVVEDAGIAERLAPAFVSAGWSIVRYRLMVQRRIPDMRGGEPEAGEVVFADLMRFRDQLAIAAGEALGTDRAHAEKIDRAIGTRCFLAQIDGRAVSGCVLWQRETDAQLDTVATLPAFRGRGAAAAAIRAATRAARESGATWIHLYTDADSGPIGLYRHLGFDDVGDITEFIRA